MRLEKIHHIGIAVRDLDSAEGQLMCTFEKGFERRGFTPSGLEYGMLKIGETELEFLSSNQEKSVIAQYIEKYGEGMHHMAFAVPDIEVALNDLQSKGIRLIDSKPKKGAQDTLTAFIHPKEVSHILLELVEEKEHE